MSPHGLIQIPLDPIPSHLPPLCPPFALAPPWILGGLGA